MFGNLIILKDGDSKADNQNNEGNDAGGAPGSMADDFIIGDGTGAPGGTDPTTDEDDHDPEEITLGAAAPVCPAILNFTNAITHSVNEVFDASEKINSSATVSPTNVVTYNAGDTIFLDNGFSANPINAGSSSFTAKIEDCN